MKTDPNNEQVFAKVSEAMRLWIEEFAREREWTFSHAVRHLIQKGKDAHLQAEQRAGRKGRKSEAVA